MISNTAHLLGADRRSIPWIKNERDHLPSVIRQAPRFAVGVLQLEIRGRVSDVGASIGL